MSALGHFLETAGIATAGISLVRENTELMRPPRALWVPFELGRPFGAPHAPAFQMRVLLSALALLDRTDGPVILEDFPDDAPESDSTASLVCPVNFPKPPNPDESDLLRAVLAETASLAPWHALFMETHGRSIATVSGLDIDAAARDVITAAGYGPRFLHRTGHGLGIDIHEPPYITATAGQCNPP